MIIRMVKTEWGSNGIQFAIFDKETETRRAVKSLQLEKVSEGESFGGTGCIGLNEAQVLMDDLWNCGIRPTEGTGSAGSLRATERHLEDMRKLVFKEV